ncbi:glycoside hydrolase family 3 N-terminal domain-containing protein [Nonomuraea recticatena]|uniref:glycoside hydrolase family 3 N-terminal domain-containing protein n=1 Tax=Nonomuraea recticatena TaxID=46178 RepID=UPI0036094347
MTDLYRLAMAVLQPGFEGTTAPDWLKKALSDGLGGAVLFARNVSPGTAGLVAELRAENPAVVVAIDEEGGVVTRLEAREGSSFPGNRALGVVDDVALTERVGRQIGRLLAETGITLNYAPSVDVNANPANPVIGIRSFGPTPELVARHSVAYVKGVQAAGVAACAKHFPGHGDTVADSHLELPTVHASLDQLCARDLPPFEAAIRAGVRSVMSAHLLIPALDPEGPATLSRTILTGLLREELGFDGMVVTDAIEMKAVAAMYPPVRSRCARSTRASTRSARAWSPRRACTRSATRSWRPSGTARCGRSVWPRPRAGSWPSRSGTARSGPRWRPTTGRGSRRRAGRSPSRARPG